LEFETGFWGGEAGDDLGDKNRHTFHTNFPTLDLGEIENLTENRLEQSLRDRKRDKLEIKMGLKGGSGKKDQNAGMSRNR